MSYWSFAKQAGWRIVEDTPQLTQHPQSGTEAATMPTIVDFPTIVQEALTVFGDVFDTEAARRHFAEYLTGLMVAERKTVSGINREFALTTDQSCLNRWLTEVAWDVTVLNDPGYNGFCGSRSTP